MLSHIEHDLGFHCIVAFLRHILLEEKGFGTSFDVRMRCLCCVFALRCASELPAELCRQLVDICYTSKALDAFICQNNGIFQWEMPLKTSGRAPET